MVWNIAVAISFAWIFNSLYESSLKKHLEERYRNVPPKTKEPSMKTRMAASFVLFILAISMGTDNLSAVFNCIPLGMIFLIAVADYRWHKIPNSYLVVTTIFILISLGIRVYFSRDVAGIFSSSFFGFLICALPVSATFFITKGAFGMGDVKLMAIVGFWLGTGKAVTFFAATFVLAAAFAVVMLALKKITRKTHIPLAPFITAATALCIGGILGELPLF